MCVLYFVMFSFSVAGFIYFLAFHRIHKVNSCQNIIILRKGRTSFFLELQMIKEENIILHILAHGHSYIIVLHLLRSEQFSMILLYNAFV